ncbi:MAG: HlyC/CorC family transporter [Legionellaceae bacterium]|nr:HlyC/CorC family transporter [Legionellaceae bacterium]
MTNFLLIMLAFALVLLNAFFVAAEFGMVKLRPTRVAAIKQRYGLRGRILSQVHQHLDAYLSACQLGITFASLGLGWIGEPAFVHLFEPVFQFLGIVSPELTSFIAFFIAFSIISFLHIVVGELMPKSLAIRQSEKISLWTAVPLYGFYWFMYPVIWILNSCSNFLLRRLGLAEVHAGEHLYSTDEIILLLNASHLHGQLSKEEMDIIEHTLDFAELKVTEIMRYREEMVMLDIQTPIHQTMQTIMEHRYTRYPVYDSSKKEVIGIIHSKDILSTLYQQGAIKELNTLIRPVLKVSRRLPAIDLLRKFREGMPHFALIYSGHDTLIGFITLDNLLHVLIGRIKDEFHRTQVDWVVNTDGSLSVRGDCSIYSLEQALGRDIDIGEEDIETLAGLIFHQLGSLPKEGDRIVFKEFEVIIEKMYVSRILNVTIYPK